MRNALVDDFRRSGSISPVPDRRDHPARRSPAPHRRANGHGRPRRSRTFLQFETAKALGGDADTPALKPAQTGLELGAGLGIGQAMAATMRETLAEPARLERAGTIECPHCHAKVPADARFCPNCGRPLQAQTDNETRPGLKEQSRLQANAARPAEKRYAERWDKSKREGRKMARRHRGGLPRRSRSRPRWLALARRRLAQEYAGSTVTIGGGTTALRSATSSSSRRASPSAAGTSATRPASASSSAAEHRLAPRPAVARTPRLPNRWGASADRPGLASNVPPCLAPLSWAPPC